MTAKVLVRGQATEDETAPKTGLEKSKVDGSYRLRLSASAARSSGWYWTVVSSASCRVPEADIALLPDSLSRKDLADGSLVEVLQDLKVVPGIAQAVFASRRGLIAAVHALIDALALGFQDLGA